MSDIDLRLGNCLELMKDIPDGSIDMILCDLPYGVTKNKWDSVINTDELWKNYDRITKVNSAIVLFGQGMFTAKLMLSNEKNHRYNIIWQKSKPTGFLNANRMPLRSHEDIVVFYKKLPKYNPQFTVGEKSHSRGNPRGKKQTNNNYGNFDASNYNQQITNEKHPKSIISFPAPHPPVHPTQKSNDLCKWLVKTYTDEGDFVLDNTMGSGTTMIACQETGRNGIGIEMDETYFKIAQNRVQENKIKLEGQLLLL